MEEELYVGNVPFVIDAVLDELCRFYHDVISMWSPCGRERRSRRRTVKRVYHAV